MPLPIGANVEFAETPEPKNIDVHLQNGTLFPCAVCATPFIRKRKDSTCCSKKCRDKNSYRLHREARLAKQKEFRDNNPDKIKEYSRADYKNHREKRMEQAKTYRLLNKDTISAKSKIRYAEDREERLQKSLEYRINNTERILLSGAKSRAKKRKIPFNLSIDDIFIPEFCPVLGIKLERGAKTVIPGSPTLDRFIPELGYTKNNVLVISHRANSLKRDGSLAEHTKLLDWMKRIENSEEKCPTA